MSRLASPHISLAIAIAFSAFNMPLLSAVQVTDEPPAEAGTWFSSQPSIYRNPIDRVPLVAIVEWESHVAAEAKVEIEGGGKQWLQAASQPASTQPQRMAILGLSPGTPYRLRVVLKVGQAEQTSQWLEYRTPPLPNNFPPLNVQVPKDDVLKEGVSKGPLAPTPGVTLFASNLWIDDESMLDYGYLIAIDQRGQVVWYCHTQERIADIRLLENGNLLYQHGNYQILREIDWLGSPVRTWYASNLLESPELGAIGVAVDTLHHEVIEMPSGNFLTLATTLEEFERFPSSELDADAPRVPARVVCDEIIEFRPADGAIVHRFPLKSVLDNERIGYMSLGNFWRDKYDKVHDLPPSRDWSHANGLVYDADDESVIVSVRHLDCLLKLDWPTGKLRWIFGEPEGWGEPWQPYLLKPQGEFAWFYHQHSPQLTEQGLLLYDNGNYRARPYAERTPAEKNATRVVEYTIDESGGTVRQRFVLDRFAGKRVYCPFYGEAEWIDADRRLLVTHGGHIEREDGSPMDQVPGERQWAEIIEWDVGESKIVWRATLDSGLESRYGWSVYRSLRLSGLPLSIIAQPAISGLSEQPSER